METVIDPTVTVLAAEIQAVKQPVATIAAVGVPNATASPTEAPATVIVKSELNPTSVDGKLSVDVALKTVRVENEIITTARITASVPIITLYRKLFFI